MVLSLYEMSNFGNVFIEAFSLGACVLAIDDGSLDGIVENGESGFLSTSPEEAARTIDRLIRDPARSAVVSQKARQTAEETFISWDDRAAKEIELIRRAVG